MTVSADYKVTPSGRKVHKMKKIADVPGDVDGDGDVDSDDKKLAKEGVVPAHMQGKQKPYVSSDGKGNFEVLGNRGQTKATFHRKEHGSNAQKMAQAHLKAKYDEYMKEEVELDENRSVADRLEVAKQMYDQKMKSAKSPAERAQAKDDYDNVVKRLKEEVEELDEVLDMRHHTTGTGSIHVSHTLTSPSRVHSIGYSDAQKISNLKAGEKHEYKNANGHETFTAHKQSDGSTKIHDNRGTHVTTIKNKMGRYDGSVKEARSMMHHHETQYFTVHDKDGNLHSSHGAQRDRAIQIAKEIGGKAYRVHGNGYSWKNDHITEAVDKQEQRFLLLARLGLVDKSEVSKLRIALDQLKADKPLSIAQRNLLLSVMTDLMSLVTGDDTIFNRVKMDVQKEDVQLDEGENKQMKGKDPCWKGYQMVGMKDKNGKKVPNCVPEETEVEEGYVSLAQQRAVWATRKDGGKGHPDNKKKTTKEEVEIEEGRMKDIATNDAEDKRLGSWRKETPWMKSKETVTDKSGAKHTPMSAAKHLARIALKKQRDKSKE